MESMSSRKREDEHRLAERAAEWLIVMKNPSETEQAEFADWLSESPKHPEEFLYTTALDQQLNRVDLQANTRFQEIMARSMSPVVKLATAPRETKNRRRIFRNPKWALGLAATIALVSGVSWYGHQRGDSYATAAGEQRMVQLDDGSTMQLTAGTRTTVTFSGDRREIQLLAGEALFKVARDAHRPFRVHSAGSVIQALGTEFYVLRRPSGTTVSVIEGAVQINQASKLIAGEEARFTVGGHIEQRTRIDTVTATARRQDRLAFRGDTLTDIASEFNRHNRTPRIVIRGDTSRAHRYTGVFDAGDPQSLLDFLREDPELVVQETGDLIIVHWSGA